MSAVGFNFKNLQAGFFDSPKVMRATNQAERRVLSRFGSFVRTRARGSIRRRKKPSQPGKPPSSHTGDIKKIFFSYDPREKSVITGPIEQSDKESKGVLATLEGGGMTTVTLRGRRRKIKIKARPTMVPAFQHEQPKLPDLWKNSVR